MISFIIKLEFNDQKYQNNVNVRDESYKRKLSFPMK